jgi:hypothetical protein
MVSNGYDRRIRSEAGDGNRDAGGVEEKGFARLVHGVSAVWTVAESFLEIEFQFVANFALFPKPPSRARKILSKSPLV